MKLKLRQGRITVLENDFGFVSFGEGEQLWFGRGSCGSMVPSVGKVVNVLYIDNGARPVDDKFHEVVSLLEP